MPFFARLPAAWVAVLLTLLVRAVVACSRLDELELELYGGSFAQALLQGMPLDPERLPIIVHLRGSVLFGLLLAPLFWLLGPTLVAVKVLAVGWSLGTAALFAWVLERRGGRAAGLAGALLLALAPPFFQMVDVLALGSHGETLLPIWAALGFLIARRGGVPKRPWELACAGFLLGFGVWFSLQFVVALPALVAAWFLAWRQEGGRVANWFQAPLRTARAGFWMLLGLLPPAAAIPYVTRTLQWVNRPAEEQFLPAGFSGVFTKIYDFLWNDLRGALLFDENGGAWASWLLLAAAGLGLVLLWPRLIRREAKSGALAPSPLAVFVLLHPLLFLGAYGATDFVVDFYNTLDGMGSRYLMPATPAVLAWVALAVCRLVGRGQRPLAWGLLAAGALPGLAGVVALSDPLPGLRQPPAFGARPFYFLFHLTYASQGDPLKYAEWAGRLDPNWPALRPLLYRVPLGRALDQTGDPYAAAAAIVARRSQPAEVAPYQLAEIGRLLVEQVELFGQPASYLSANFANLSQLAQHGKISQEECERVVHGAFQHLVMFGGGRAIKNGGSSPYAYLLLAQTPAELRPIAADGLGFMTGVRFAPYDRGFAENLRLLKTTPELLPTELREPFFFSLGLGCRFRFIEASYRAEAAFAQRIEAYLPDFGLEPFRRGLAAGAEVWRAAR
jgi:hypothetical protein